MNAKINVRAHLWELLDGVWTQVRYKQPDADLVGRLKEAVSGKPNEVLLLNQFMQLGQTLALLQTRDQVALLRRDLGSLAEGLGDGTSDLAGIRAALEAALGALSGEEPSEPEADDGLNLTLLPTPTGDEEATDDEPEGDR